MKRFKYLEIATAIEEQISDGVFRPGERLPSLREFSSRRGVSLNTVLAAYVELERLGLVEGRESSGFYVKAQSQSKSPPLESPSRLPRAKTSKAVSSRRVVVPDLAHEVMLSANDASAIPLGFVAPAPDFLPLKSLSALVKEVSKRKPECLTSYIFPPGDLELRKQLARRSIEEGIGATPDDFLITSGAMEGLELALRSTTRPGDTVAVESPSHFNLFPLFAALGLRALEVPSENGLGISLPLLFRALKNTKVKAVLLTPNFSSPQGTLMPEERKRELVMKLQKLSVPIIEDNVYGEIYFGKNRPPSLISYDSDGGVISCSSFSKTLGGGWRVGWMRGGRYQATLERLKFMSTIGTSSLPQSVIAEFLRQGLYDRHLRTLRRKLHENAQLLSAAVTQHFGSEARVAIPAGGYSLWCELAAGDDSEHIFRAARKVRISLTPGALFATQPRRYNHCLRLGFGSPITRQTTQAVRQLAQLTLAQR